MQRFRERRKILDRAIQALEKYQRLVAPLEYAKSGKVRSRVPQTTAAAA